MSRNIMLNLFGLQAQNKHIFSGRFQYASGFPYTPIVDGTEDLDYAADIRAGTDIFR